MGFTSCHFSHQPVTVAFAPVDYDQVDPAFGDWEDVKRLGDKYYLMFDFMINHISRQSKYYKDYQKARPKCLQGSLSQLGQVLARESSNSSGCGLDL